MTLGVAAVISLIMFAGVFDMVKFSIAAPVYECVCVCVCVCV